MLLTAKKFVLAFAVMGTLALAAPAAAFAAWGALAVGGNSSLYGYGYSYNYSTRAAAQSRALHSCAKHSSGCKLIFTVSGTQCGAASISGSTVFHSFGSSEGAATDAVKDAWPSAHFIYAVCASSP